MCKNIENITKNIKIIAEEAIQNSRKNDELEEYNVLGVLSIEGNRDIVYVSDINTHEVLFMNENAVNVFGDGIGKLCYKVFHNLDSPCKYCNNAEIKANLMTPVHWPFYNQVSEELYFITDIATKRKGRIIRFERATPLNGSTKKIVEIVNKFDLL